MYRTYPQPAIIGAGLSGVLISLALTKARIGHLLIGGPPPSDGPRLGESLGLEATLYFLSEYPELADCYYEKRFATAYGGTFSSNVDFSKLRSLRSIVALGLWGKRAPTALLHIDRVRIDAALYQKAIQSPFCTQVDTQVTDVLYQSATDRVQALQLADGTSLPVSHLFDATGYIRLLARKLNIPRRILSETQRVVYVHYYRHAPVGEASLPDSTWQLSTSIMRLYQEHFGLDGLAWCIPLGNTISSGITTSPENQQSDEMLLHYAQEAFRQQGVDLSTFADGHSRIGRAQMQFYTHPRAYGANWLLTAAAHTQIWWPTSTGLDSAVTAAQAAGPFLRNPKRVGVQYEKYLASLVQSHSVWNWVATHRVGMATEAKIHQLNGRLFWSTNYRLLTSFTLEERNLLLQTTATLAAQTQGMELWSQLPPPHTVHRLNPEELVNNGTNHPTLRPSESSK